MNVALFVYCAVCRCPHAKDVNEMEDRLLIKVSIEPSKLLHSWDQKIMTSDQQNVCTIGMHEVMHSQCITRARNLV